MVMNVERSEFLGLEIWKNRDIKLKKTKKIRRKKNKKDRIK